MRFAGPRDELRSTRKARAAIAARPRPKRNLLDAHNPYGRDQTERIALDFAEMADENGNLHGYSFRTRP